MGLMRIRMLPRASAFCLALALAVPVPGSGQSVVVDEGTFAITIGGTAAGSESFAIRRSGLGSDGTLLAHGTVTLTVSGESSEVHPILQAVPADGSATEYQVNTTGANASEARLARTGNRYISQFRSAEGTEEREFLARPGTRILEVMVAHQYYFLRGLREGMPSFVIEPRTRRSLQLPVTGSEDVELQVGPNAVPARRVTFGQGEDTRIVWYDGQGHVLRVEVPALGYAAQREDLAG